MSIPAAVKLIMINIYKYILWYDDFLTEKKICINIIIRNLFQKSLLGINKNSSMIKA